MIIEALLGTTRSVRYGVHRLLYRQTDYAERLVKLKGGWRGQPALVVGNGPSLNNTPLDEFLDVPSIGMNKINLLFPRVEWRPRLIVCANPMVMKQNRSFFSTTEIPVYLNWKGRWYLKNEHRRAARLFLETHSTSFSQDLTLGIGSSPTVTYVALQFAFYLEANPVILFGVDHSFNVTGRPMHYVRSTGPDLNHFDPSYFGPGVIWGLPDLDGSERAYREAKDVFETSGRRVYDATVGGKLKVFPHISVAEARSLCAVV